MPNSESSLKILLYIYIMPPEDGFLIAVAAIKREEWLIQRTMMDEQLLHSI